MTHTRRAIAAAAASVLTRTMMRPREVRTKMLLNREFLLPQYCAVLHLQKKKSLNSSSPTTGVVVVELKPITATALMINDGRKK